MCVDNSDGNRGGDGGNDAHPRLVHVLYGSQTGNAEEIARRIHSELEEHDMKAGKLLAIRKYGEIGLGSSPDVPLTVFVISTTGEGDAPDNANAFLRFLRKKTHPAGLLSNFKYALLGLGDTNYSNFCNGSKRLEKALVSHGARNIYERGEADDEVGLESVVEPWIDKLWAALQKQLAASNNENGEKDDTNTHDGGRDTVKNESKGGDTSQPAVAEDAGPNKSHGDQGNARKAKGNEDRLRGSDRVPEEAINGMAKLLLPRRTVRNLEDADGGGQSGPLLTDMDKRSSVSGYVSRAEKLSGDDSLKAVWHVEITCEHEVDYRPGDAFGMIVGNATEDIDNLLQLCSFDGERRVCLMEAENCLVKDSTVRKLLNQRCDLTSPLKKTMLRALAEHCDVESDRRALKLLCSKTGSSAYKTLFFEHRATLMDVLALYPSCKPPLELLLDQLPPLSPRYYSASSAKAVDGCVLHFAFSLVSYKAMGRTRRGVATGMLQDFCMRCLAGEDLRGSPIYLTLRQGSAFVPPNDLFNSYIMVGPGTGVAPFRGFLRERRQRSKDGGEDAASVILFTGFRHRKTDFLYGDELQKYVDDGLLELFVAFSRDQPERVYVQDVIREKKEKVAKLLTEDNSSRLYVCGDGGDMAKGVDAAVCNALESVESLDKDSAKEKLAELTRNGRYLRDVWYYGDQQNLPADLASQQEADVQFDVDNFVLNMDRFEGFV